MEIPERPIRGGHRKVRELRKWEFYSVASEEMVTYVDNKENQTSEMVQTEIPTHTHTPVPKNEHTTMPVFMIFYIEECLIIGVK